MSQFEETFFTRLGCMDGRIQQTIRLFGQKKFHAEYPDTITGPGEVGLLAQDPSDGILFQLKQELSVSLDNHHSKGIIVHGHQECAGNPVDDKTHIEQIKKSVEVIHNLIHGKVPVVGVFVKRSPKDSSEWIVEEIFEMNAVDPVGQL